MPPQTMVDSNPACGFELSDMGGTEVSRSRWLKLDELVALAWSMRETQNFGRFNELAIWLPLALCVRKMELLSAKWSEFDLEKGIWKLQPGPPQTFRSANLGGIAPSRDEIIAAI